MTRNIRASDTRVVFILIKSTFLLAGMSRALGTVKVAENVGRTLGVKTTGFASLFVIYRAIECIAKEPLFCRKYDEQENQDYEKRDCYSSDCRGSHSILELYLSLKVLLAYRPVLPNSFQSLPSQRPVEPNPPSPRSVSSSSLRGFRTIRLIQPISGAST